VSLLKFIFEKINKVIFKNPHFFAIKFFFCVFIDYFLCSSEKFKIKVKEKGPTSQ
jgi:hypothetical protein